MRIRPAFDERFGISGETMPLASRHMQGRAMRVRSVPVFVPSPARPSVVVCDAPPDHQWVTRVAREFDAAGVIFVWGSADRWSASAVRSTTPVVPAHGDLVVAAGLLVQENRLRTGGDIVFGCADPAAPGTTVDVNVSVPTSSMPAQRDELLTADGMEAWIEQHNAAPVSQIVQSLRSAMGVIPFLGAGTSYPFDYPLWGEFFVRFATAAANGALGTARPLADERRDDVIAFVETQQFEKAADILVHWNSVAFYAEVAERFGKEPMLGAPTPLTRLPLIAPGPIITTNFDPVIETVYRELGRPFTNDRRILGARQYPDRVVTALQQNWSALIKLHGDACDPDSLVFTGIEYEQGYGDITRSPGPIERLATVIYTNRPLLFIGCSLETDRTLTSLQNVYARNPYIGHYAVLPALFRASHRDARLSKLHAAGIRTMWYHPGRHEDIDLLLSTLVEATAVDELTVNAVTHPSISVGGPAVSAATSTGVPASHEWPEITKDHISTVAGRLAAGELVLFVGSAVHSHRVLHGQTFYEEICRRASIPWPSRDRTDVAQYLADVDRRQLSTIVSDLIHREYTQPGAAHHDLATLSRRLTALAVKPLVIITTNYDTAIEAAFDIDGQPYHLFVYHHSGSYAGRFLHRRPDGREFAIRSPAAIDASLSAPAIVKLNGGFDPREQWEETFVVASSDFEELSTRLPDVLPQVIWDALRKRSVLFMGHGLREPDVRSLIRHRHRQGAPDSWALQLKKTDEAYWRIAGIVVMEADLRIYVKQLLAALTPTQP